MKKLTTSVLFVTVFVLGLNVNTKSANACSWAPGTVHSTYEDVIDDGGSIFIGKTVSSGPIVAAEVVHIEEGDLPMYVVMHVSGNSCTTYFGQNNSFSFNQNQYFLAVSAEDNSSVILHSEGDEQFTWFYDSLSDAEQGLSQLLAGQNPIVNNYQNPNLSNVGEYVPVGYTLRSGNRGDVVKRLQEALNRVLSGTDMITDGVYGSKTNEAVRAFQLRFNLFVDGVAGPNTQNKLKEVLEPVTMQHN